MTSGRTAAVSATQEAAHTDGDVSSVIVNHRKRTVRMVMSVVTIDADGGSSYRPTLFRFSLVNGRGLVKVFDLNQDNRLRVRRLADGSYSATRCRWVHHSVDTRTDRVTVTIPRSCMRNPKVVRLEASVVDWDRSGVGYVDDAYTPYDTTGRTAARARGSSAAEAHFFLLRKASIASRAASEANSSRGQRGQLVATGVDPGHEVAVEDLLGLPESLGRPGGQARADGGHLVVEPVGGHGLRDQPVRRRLGAREHLAREGGERRRRAGSSGGAR